MYGKAAKCGVKVLAIAPMTGTICSRASSDFKRLTKQDNRPGRGAIPAWLIV
jgi:hypothetical protein